MHYLGFLDAGIDRGLSLSGTYNPALVIISILIASLAAYSAFGLGERIRASVTPVARRSWLIAGAIAMGLGVWSMHFIGMLALGLPVPVTYDVLITLVSIVPATFASWVVLLITSRARVERSRLILGGILMGVGIGTMHYTGMAAMRMAAAMFYDPALLVGSVIVAMLLSMTALHTNSLVISTPKRSRNYWIKLGAASVMGLAIAGMHYTGMAAVSFFPTSTSYPAAEGLDPMVLGVLVSLAASLILALIIFVASVDRRLRAADAQLEHELGVAKVLRDEAKERVDGPLLGESLAVRALREAITAYALTDETLLLTGPPGAGQEAVARAIHDQSQRAPRAFIHVNCATLQTNQQSIIFGSLPSESYPLPEGGRFRLADGGTLYLDNVNELSSGIQEQLVKVLEELDGRRKRGEQPRPDVRVIAFTSSDLVGERRGPSIGPALHQTLCRRQLSVPALAERREDIPILVQYFIEQLARRLSKTIGSVSDASMGRLQAYRWTENIRELHNLLERAILHASGPVLTIDESLLDGGIPLDRYRLIQKLGSGGMGEVWLARHQLLARPAAVKLIRSDVLADSDKREKIIKRFEREAQITANLNSPNTVRLYDFGVSETGSFYLVMELLSGIDLQSMVDQFGPLPPARVIMLLQQACRSLSEAHEVGFVHRDIKPSNLFNCKLGREYDFLKVLDFGVVKAASSEEETLITVTGNVVGTPGYMAPELFMGGKVDPRTDLYSLGCVAYWMLTGRPVFESENLMQLAKYHVETPPDPPSKVVEIRVPESLDEIVLACIEKAPHNRPNSADELWQMLADIGAGEPWTARQAKAWWQLHLPECGRSVSLPDHQARSDKDKELAV